ncbi:TetR/AcrR family transcriptional regulator [Streptomyces sp. NPDC048179]|uniref:TetR/AcrR family transcriptional regulator n=1 Tax=Streptomyces sp. NPDC048179 TaxID=3365506 RepID=UPI00371024B3
MIRETRQRQSLGVMLLDLAEEVLRERGTDALSLRELAREAGVSHGAPRTHFIDRAALLDALAERGFDRLADRIQASMSEERDSYGETLRSAADAIVDFAVSNAALADLMFAAKADAPSPGVSRAAGRLFATLTTLIESGVAAGAFAPDRAGRLPLLFAAVMQGVAGLAASRHILPGQLEALIDDAVELVLSSSGVDPAP